jgi:hypothetical protein
VLGAQRDVRGDRLGFGEVGVAGRGIAGTGGIEVD